MQRKERISPGRDFLMKLVAAGFDVIGALANLTGIGGTVVGIFGDLTFILWYLIIGEGLLRPRSLRRAGISFIIELIPLVNVLPGYSLFVWRQNRAIRKEDDEFNKINEAKIKEEENRRKITAEEAERARQARLMKEGGEVRRKVSIDEGGNPIWQEVNSSEEDLNNEKKTKDEEISAEIEEIKNNPIPTSDLPGYNKNTLGSARVSRTNGDVEYENNENVLSKRDAGYTSARKRPFSPTSQSQAKKIDGVRSSSVIGSAPVLRKEGDVSFEESKQLGNNAGPINYSSPTKSLSSTSSNTGLSYSHTVRSSIPGYMEKRDSSETMRKIKKFYGERNVITPKTVEDARKRFKDDLDIQAFLNNNPNNIDVADQINML